MRYACLVLDHDDTVFDSGYSVHYQAFLESLSVIKPDLPKPSFLEFTRANFHLGFTRMCRELYGFDDQDFNEEYRIWKNYTQNHPPQAFDGWKDVLKRFKSQGGLIAVVSFSERDEILRDYQNAFNFHPDLIFANDTHPKLLKPHAHALYTCLDQFSLQPCDLLVIDDNPAGFQMAQVLNADFLYATYAHQDDVLIHYLHEKKSPILHCIADLEHILF